MLKTLRKQIDGLDKKITQLLNQRAGITSKIGCLKRKQERVFIRRTAKEKLSEKLPV